MNKLFLAAAALTLLAACSSGSSSTTSSAASTGDSSDGSAATGSGGFGGGSGEGGAKTCSSCSDVVVKGAPSTSLCSDGAGADFEALQECACDQGPCGQDCYGNLCMGDAADEGCQACLDASCADTYGPCKAD